MTIATQSASPTEPSRSTEERPCSGSSGHVRVVVGDLGALVAQELDQLQRGRLAQVADVGLVGDADEVDSAALDATSRAELSARVIFSRQKYGMFSLTLPASSMNSV